MQKKNQQEEEYYEKNMNSIEKQVTNSNGKDKSRSHFIRKQQSTLRIPRTCGVSYIKSS